MAANPMPTREELVEAIVTAQDVWLATTSEATAEAYTLAQRRLAIYDAVMGPTMDSVQLARLRDVFRDEGSFDIYRAALYHALTGGADAK